MTDISVIVPIYNAEKYLNKCIKSLINQTKKELEFILVNDGSTDSSEEIIKSYKDKRIKYYKNENQGIGKTRNFGIDKATGKYIMFLDSDDYLVTDACEEVYKKAETENLDLVVCDFYRIEEDKKEEIKMPEFKNTTLKKYPNLTSKYSHPLQWEEFIFRHPELRICLSRFAWPWNREMYMLMLKFRNVYTDTSIVYFDDPKQMYHQMFTVDMGPKWLDRSFRHQVMFGSGDPGLEQIRQINAIRNLDMREESKELILSQNALEFMGYKKDMRWVHD